MARADVETRSRLVAIVGLLSACAPSIQGRPQGGASVPAPRGSAAGAPAATRPPATARPRSVHAAPLPERSLPPALVPARGPALATAQQARVALAAESASTFDHWSEIVVEGAGEAALRACAALLQDELRVDLPGLRARVEQGCRAAPLPPVAPPPTGAFLLVHSRALAPSEPALLGLAPGVLEGLGALTLHAFTRFATRAECERVLGELTSAERRASAEAREVARGWLERQLGDAIVARDRGCAEQGARARRCARSGGAAAVDEACRASRQGPRCRRAVERAFERQRCELELERGERSCAQGRLLVEALRRRQASPPEADPSGSPLAVCRVE